MISLGEEMLKKSFKHRRNGLNYAAKVETKKGFPLQRSPESNENQTGVKWFDFWVEKKSNGLTKNQMGIRKQPRSLGSHIRAFRGSVYAGYRRSAFWCVF